MLDTHWKCRQLRGVLAMVFIALPSLLLFASDVAAQDGVLVVPHGGVRTLPQMTIERVGDQWSVSD